MKKLETFEWIPKYIFNYYDFWRNCDGSYGEEDFLQDGRIVILQELEKGIEVNESYLMQKVLWKFLDISRKLEHSRHFVSGIDIEDKMVGNFLPIISDKDFVEQLLNKLSHEEFQLIKLKYYDGLTQKEIAKRLDMSECSVSRKLGKILNVLRAKAILLN